VSAHSLLSASYIDLDYESSSESLIITSYWATAPEGKAWDETIDYQNHERVEVGVLNPERSEEPHELKIGGWLTVVGHDVKPSTIATS